MGRPKKRQKKQGKIQVVAAPRPIGGTFLKPLLTWLCLGFFFLLPWLILGPVSDGTVSQQFCLSLLDVFLLGGLAYGCAAGILAIPRSRYFLPWIGWAAAFGVASVLSLRPWDSLWGSYRSVAGGEIYFLTSLVPAFTLLALDLTVEDIRLAVGLLLAQAAILSVSTLQEAVALNFPYRLVRPPSPLGNSDFFISYALLLLPLAACFSMQAWKERRSSYERLMTTGSGLLLAAALCLTLPNSLQQAAWRVPVALHLPTPQLSQVDLEPATASGFLGDSNNAERFTEWKFGLQIGGRRPVIGTGPGTVRSGFFRLVESGGVPDWHYETNSVMDNPHNDLIEQFSTTGLLGVAAYLAVWASAFWALWKCRHSLAAEKRLLVAGLAGGLLLFFLFNQFLFTSFFTGLIVRLWVAFLLLLCGGVRFEPSARRWLAAGAATACLLAALAAYGGWTYLSAEQDAQLAIQAEQPGNSGTDLDAANLAQAASDLFPHGDYYAWMAATDSLQLYLAPPAGVELDKAALAAQIRHYAARAEALEPASPQYALTEAIIAYQLAEPGSAAEKGAAEDIQRAIALAPRYPLSYQQAGDAYAQKGSYPQARKLFTEGLKLASPDQWSIFTGRLDRLSQFEAAAKK